MNKLLTENIQEIRNVCDILNVQELYVFGSVLRKDFNEKSDLDFLLNFKESLTVEEYTENYFKLHYALREILEREIDIVTEKSLSNPYFIKVINDSKKLIYESGNH